MILLLEKLLAPMLKAEIDYLVLGCSHYPYLIPLLKEILPENVQIIDSGEAVARQTKSILSKNDLLNLDEGSKPVPQFYSNIEPQVLSDIIEAEKYHYQVEELDF